MLAPACSSPPPPDCSLAGNRVVSLILQGQFIETITKHSASCCSSLRFLGESHRYGLASIMVRMSMPKVLRTISIHQL